MRRDMIHHGGRVGVLCSVQQLAGVQMRGAPAPASRHELRPREPATEIQREAVIVAPRRDLDISVENERPPATSS